MSSFDCVILLTIRVTGPDNVRYKYLYDSLLYDNRTTDRCAVPFTSDRDN